MKIKKILLAIGFCTGFVISGFAQCEYNLRGEDSENSNNEVRLNSTEIFEVFNVVGNQLRDIDGAEAGPYLMLEEDRTCGDATIYSWNDMEYEVTPVQNENLEQDPQLNNIPAGTTNRIEKIKSEGEEVKIKGDGFKLKSENEDVKIKTEDFKYKLEK